MLFDIPFLADWNKIGEHRQHQTDLNTECENRSCCDWDYKVGDKVLLRKDGILHKSESQYECDPWTITSVHTNGTIRVQCGSESERLNFRRVMPFLITRLVIDVIVLRLFPSYTTFTIYYIHDQSS